MKINWNYVEKESIVSEKEKEQLNEIKKIMEKKERMLDWLDIETSISEKEIVHIETLSKKIRTTCDIFIVIGIGGSYLGSKAVIDSLTPYFESRKPEIIFAGYQLSPEYLKNLLTYLKGKKVALNVISKSGETLEPIISFHVLYKYLKENYIDYRKRVIVTTDQEKGFLNSFAQKEELEVLTIPREIGGRYSIFTTVGLFPIAVAGIDIRELINGAKSMRGCFETAGKLAITRKHLEEAGKVIEAFTFYEEKLSSVASWAQQLFAETQGKEKKGILPILNPNTTNLHSVGQYLQEGRDVVFETVLSIQEMEDLFLEEYNLTMHQINQLVEKQVATAHYLGKTPSIMITLERLTPVEIGKLLYFLEVSAAIGGYLLGIDPFNQPGVEAYKNLVNQELQNKKFSSKD